MGLNISIYCYENIFIYVSQLCGSGHTLRFWLFSAATPPSSPFHKSNTKKKGFDKLLVGAALRTPPSPFYPVYKSNSLKRVWQTAGGQSGPRCLLWLIPVCLSVGRLCLHSVHKLPTASTKVFHFHSPPWWGQLQNNTALESVLGSKSAWFCLHSNHTSSQKTNTIERISISFRIESAGCRTRRRTWIRRR